MLRSARIQFIPFGMPHAQEFIDKCDDWVKAHPERNYQTLVYAPGRVKMLESLAADSEIYFRGHGTPGGNISCTYTYDGLQFNPAKRKMMPGKVSDHLELKVEEACQRLIDMGLESSFGGDIKFYFCNSGTPPTDQDLETAERRIRKTLKDADAMEQAARDMGITIRKAARLEKADKFGAAAAYRQKVEEYERFPTPMARRGADYFRSKGFGHCRFWGYLGKLTGTYGDILNEDEGDAAKRVKFADGKQHRGVHIDERNPTERAKQEYRRAKEGRISF